MFEKGKPFLRSLTACILLCAFTLFHHGSAILAAAETAAQKLAEEDALLGQQEISAYLEGSVTAAVPVTGTVYIEGFADYWDGQLYESDATTILADNSTYRLEMPAGSTVWVVVWSDEDGNGIPNPGDIMGIYEQNPVELNSADYTHTGIDIVLDTELSGVWGRITDTGGHPLAGVHLFAMRSPDGADWCESYNAYSVTDPDGMFALTGIPTGMLVKIQISGLINGYEEGFWSESGVTPSCAQATEYQSNGAGTDALSIVLQPASRISGRVMDMEGNPLPGSWLTIFDAGSGEELGEGESDDSGYYSFNFKTAPSGQVKVAAQGDWNSGYISMFYNNRPDMVTADPLEAPVAADINGIDFYLTLGASISGRAIFADGLPATGIVVDVYDAQTLWWVQGSSTDSAGDYEIKGLLSGDYIVMFSNYMVNAEPDYTFYDNVKTTDDATVISLNHQGSQPDIDLMIPAYLCDLDKDGSCDSVDLNTFATVFGSSLNSKADFDLDYDIDGSDLYLMAKSRSLIGR